VAINVAMIAMVVGIFALLCDVFHILIISPFPLLLPLLGSFSMFFLLGTAWFPFLMAYVF
jgi:hypothetical protein